MHQVEVSAGTRIDNAAERLVSAAREHGEATCEFNGIKLVARSDATVAAVLADWDAKQRAGAEAHRNSPEGIEAERRSEERRAAAQQKHDALMRRLPQLDFGNDVAVLDWLCEMQEPSDHSGVIVRKKTILEAFAKHGFTPGVNCGPDFRPESRENVHRWLVGQCLDGLESVAIHGVVHKFAADWKKKFGVITTV